MNGLEAAKNIVQRLRERGHIALFAGGCVRDRLLGLIPTDYDVATDATPDQICRVFRRTKLVGAQFGVVLVRMNGVEVEVATFRTDLRYHDGRRPEAVVFSTPEEDAQRRDFTINGMFLDPFDDKVVDFVGGRQDLADKLIRCIGDPGARFAEDHLRMLRAVRFAARLGFVIEAETHAAICRYASQISAISAERIRMELELVLGHSSRAEGWRMIVETGLVSQLIRGVAWNKSQAERTRRVLLELPAGVSESLGFAAVFCCFSPALVRTACQKLRCSTAVTRGAMYLLEAARRIQQGAIRELADVKFLLASGQAHETLVLAHALTIVDGTDLVRVAELIGRCERIDPADYAPSPLVTGDDLIALKLAPGPQYREILDQLYRAQLNEELTTRQNGLDRARSLVRRVT